MPNIILDSIAAEAIQQLEESQNMRDYGRALLHANAAVDAASSLIYLRDPDEAQDENGNLKGIIDLLPNTNEAPRLFDTDLPVDRVDGLMAASPLVLLVRKPNYGLPMVYTRFGELRIKVRPYALFSRIRYGFDAVLDQPDNSDVLKILSMATAAIVSSRLAAMCPSGWKTNNAKMSFFMKRSDMNPVDVVAHDADHGHKILLETMIANMVDEAARNALAAYDAAEGVPNVEEAFFDAVKVHVSDDEREAASMLLTGGNGITFLKVTYPGKEKLGQRIDPNTDEPYNNNDDDGEDDRPQGEAPGPFDFDF